MNAETYRETELLVLRKTPYGETSIIIAGLAPELGQLHFLVRGGHRLSPKSFPVADLFRILRVEFKASHKDLLTWRTAELKEDFRDVAQQSDCFAAAAWLARFTLANTHVSIAHPRFYQALCVGLRRLADSAKTQIGLESAPFAATVGACIVYLEESGHLPHYPDGTPGAHRRQSLLEMGLGERQLNIPRNQWEQLHDWILQQLRHSDLETGPRRFTDHG